MRNNSIAGGRTCHKFKCADEQPLSVSTSGPSCRLCENDQPTDADKH